MEAARQEIDSVGLGGVVIPSMSRIVAPLASSIRVTRRWSSERKKHRFFDAKYSGAFLGLQVRQKGGRSVESPTHPTFRHANKVFQPLLWVSC